jgi:hypothetical protein
MELDIQLEKYLEDYIKIQNNFDFISLGGSLPLMIYGKIPFRKIKDFDIISTQYVDKSEILYKAFNKMPPTFPIRGNHIIHNNHKFDLFINPNATYDFIFFEGYNLRLSPIEEILFHKSYHLHKKKTVEDFKTLVNNI